MKKTIIVAICLSFVVLFCAQIVLAAEVNFKPQITLPGSDFEKGVTTTPSIAKYVQGIYNYAIGIVGILAAVVLMWGGVVWLTSGGSAERVNSAKSWIGAALSGLVLVLTSYLILSTINPDLVIFKPLEVINVGEKRIELVCCEGVNKDLGNVVGYAEIMTEKKCEEKKGIPYFNSLVSNKDETKCVKSGCCQIMTAGGQSCKNIGEDEKEDCAVISRVLSMQYYEESNCRDKKCSRGGTGGGF